MKIGIIGAGRIAEAHLNAMQHIKEIHSLYIYDLKYENAKSVASKFGGIPIKEFEETISNCDAIIITSPNHCHAVQSLDILRASKHLLCEKPMASSLEEAKEMTSLARQTDVISSLGFNYRYLPIIREIEKLIQKDFFSDILHFSFFFKKSSALIKNQHTWRDGPEGLLTSGALGDLGSHLFDTTSYLLNSNFDYHTFKVKSKTYVPYKENKKVYVDDYSYICGRLENGIYFNLLASKASLPEESELCIHIIGSENELRYTSRSPETYYTKSHYTWVERSLAHAPLLEDPKGEVSGWADSFYYQLKDWIRQIQGRPGSTQIATFFDGLAVQKTLNYILKTQLEKEISHGSPYLMPNLINTKEIKNPLLRVVNI